MKTNIKKLPKSKIEIIAEVSADEMKPFVVKSIVEIGKKTNIKGFRPGKAPKEIVEKEAGEFKIYEEAAISAIKKYYPQIIAENKFEAIGEPKIEITKLAPGDSVEFKAEISILPEVKAGNYRKIREKKNKAEVKNEAVEEEMKKIQKSRAKFVTVRRPAAKGDRVEVNFTARLGGVKIEGGESKNHPLTIGESHFVPGFEDNLIGIKEGESKKFSVVFPTDYREKYLSEKKVDFEVQMILVQEQILPEMNDEFAKGLGKFKDLADLKSSVKEGLFLEEEKKESQRVRIKVIERIVSESELELPEILAHYEVHKMLDEFRANIENMGLKFETYLEKIGKNEEELEKEWIPEAEKRAKIDLVLRHIAQKEKIEVTEKEIEEEINNILASFSNIEEAKKKIDLLRLKEYTYGVLINRKTFDLLEKSATNN